MRWNAWAVLGAAGTALAVGVGTLVAGVAQASPRAARPAAARDEAVTVPAGVRLPLLLRVTRRANGPQVTTAPAGLSPASIAAEYGLQIAGPSAGTAASGTGQVIALVDAFRDGAALANLNHFNAQYGLPKMPSCKSLTQAGSCLDKVAVGAKPPANAAWVLEESLDMEWAHAMAPGAKILLIEAPNSGLTALMNGVKRAVTMGANEVSMSWFQAESVTPGEATFDPNFTHPGTLFTAASGDAGHGAQFPASSPDVISVGGTTLANCSGTTCSGPVSESAWSGSSGGASAQEPVPSYQAKYTGPVASGSSLATLAGGKRASPDVSFDGDPASGVSVYDTTTVNGQSGWITVGGTSVGAPAWAGILAAGASAGATALQGNGAIYGGGFKTNLRDITTGQNGTCGADCAAGKGYDLVTGLGSPIGYP